MISILFPLNRFTWGLNQIVCYLSGDLGQALFIRSCHEDAFFTRKSHNCAETAFAQGDSAGGSKLTEQTLQTIFIQCNFT